MPRRVFVSDAYTTGDNEGEANQFGIHPDVPTSGGQARSVTCEMQSDACVETSFRLQIIDFVYLLSLACTRGQSHLMSLFSMCCSIGGRKAGYRC